MFGIQLRPNLEAFKEGNYGAGAGQSADALAAVREAFESQGKGKTAKTPAVKRQAAGKTWCVLLGFGFKPSSHAFEPKFELGKLLSERHCLMAEL